MSHPYLDQPITGVHDWPEDCVEDEPVKLFTIKTPRGTRAWSPNLDLLKNIRSSLWPPSHETKLPRYTIRVAGEVKRG